VVPSIRPCQPRCAAPVQPRLRVWVLQNLKPYAFVFSRSRDARMIFV
jgi:hypothetical protein